MRALKALLSIATAALLCGVAVGAAAQQMEPYGDHEVHYSAIPTGLLTDQVAQARGIVRSRSKALLLVTILENGEPVTGAVQASVWASNDDDPTDIPMRQVRENGWVSYIGTFDFESGQSRNFAVSANPHGREGPFELTFRQALQNPD